MRQAVDPTDPLLVQACFGEARVLQRLGRTQEAIELLAPVAQGDDFQARQEADARIAVLKSRLGQS